MDLTHGHKMQDRPRLADKRERSAVLDDDCIRVRSVIAVLSTKATGTPHRQLAPADSQSWLTEHREFAEGVLELAVLPDGRYPNQESIRGAETITLLMGDMSEWAETRGESCMAHGVSLEFDFRKGSVKTVGSIVGLPPIFLYESDGLLAITSSMHLLTHLPEIKREIDVDAIRDLFQIGYPVNHRTLLKHVKLMDAGHAVYMDVSGRVESLRAWAMPDPQPMTDWREFVDLQAGAFVSATEKLEFDGSFLSLSGGLDTRTIFAALQDVGASLPAATISGTSLSIDARIARSLCQSYGIQHTIVGLDEEFVKDLPEYVQEASFLSGGIVGLEHSHEVFFNRQVRHLGSQRVSGNLGNQVGRMGVEGTSLRNADTGLLNHELTASWRPAAGPHWLTTLSATLGEPLLGLLLAYEIPFTSVGNFCIGQHYAVQMTPYASRRLIETYALSPAGSQDTKPFTTSNARLKDLRHRFLGENRSRSFQCAVIAAHGGYAADCPINWGWRARGGVSPTGLFWGGVGLLDTVSRLQNPVSKALAIGLGTVGLAGAHEIRHYRRWLTTGLREFVQDTLRSTIIKESGLFSFGRVDTILNEHYSKGNCQYATLVAGLDLALAVTQYAKKT